MMLYLCQEDSCFDENVQYSNFLKCSIYDVDKSRFKSLWRSEKWRNGTVCPRYLESLERVTGSRK